MDPPPDSLLDAIETRITAGLREDAEAVGIMEATARLLLALGSADGLPMQEVSRVVGRDPSTVTRFVIRARGKGLVEQRRGTEDRRQRRLYLTPEGRRVRGLLVARRLARARALKEGVLSKTGLSPEEVDWFLRVLLEGLAEESDGAVSA